MSVAHWGWAVMRQQKQQQYAHFGTMDLTSCGLRAVLLARGEVAVALVGVSSLSPAKDCSVVLLFSACISCCLAATWLFLPWKAATNSL